MEGLWKLAKWVRNKEQNSFQTSSLREEGGPLEPKLDKKFDLLHKNFFPPARETNFSDIAGQTYPDPVTWPLLSERELRKTFLEITSKKSPESDSILNLILKTLESILTPVLTPIFNACINFGHCPHHFKQSITVVLCQGIDPCGYSSCALMFTALGRRLIRSRICIYIYFLFLLFLCLSFFLQQFLCVHR